MAIEALSDLVQQTIWLSLMLSAPVLLAALGSGLLISVFQAATQVNEQTLTFVPKIVLTLVVFALTFPHMMTQLSDFMVQLLERTP